jgi:hypothetical protein
METYGYIYKTTNLVNEKSYIGQHKSKDWDLNYIGSGKLLKKAIKKYGKEYFQCFPLAWAWGKEELNKLEIDYIAHYKPEYNIASGGEGGNVGEEAYKKISKALSGRKLPEETRRKIGEASKGNNYRQDYDPWNKGKINIYSEETIQKMSESKKNKYVGENNPFYGKHHTQKTKQKISEIHKGKIISEETKQKISEKLKGQKQYEMTDKIRKKISDTKKGCNSPNKGKTFSENWKTNLSESHKGKVLSEEIKQKMSEAQKRRWQNKNAA